MKRILLIDEGNEIAEHLTALVSASKGAFQLQSAPDTEGALHRVRAWKPHVILIRASEGASEATELSALVKRIRAASVDEYSAILLVHADLSSRGVAAAIEAGADDALALPLAQGALVLRLGVSARLKELNDSVRRANRRLDEMANTDEVTGLMNLKAIYRRGEEEIDRSSRFQKPVSALMLNLDAFAAANRDHGFTYGNYVLQEVARRIKSCVRSIDFAGRVGGDEFFVFLKETDLSEAEFMAERIRQAIGGDGFRSDQISCDLTASLGVGGFTPGPELSHGHEMKDLLHITSEALRSAKAAGPDHIEIYSFG